MRPLHIGQVSAEEADVGQAVRVSTGSVACRHLNLQYDKTVKSESYYHHGNGKESVMERWNGNTNRWYYHTDRNPIGTVGTASETDAR